MKILNEHYDDRFGSSLSFLWRLRDCNIFLIECLQAANRSNVEMIAAPQVDGLILESLLKMKNGAASTFETAPFRIVQKAGGLQ